MLYFASAIHLNNTKHVKEQLLIKLNLRHKSPTANYPSFCSKWSFFNFILFPLFISLFTHFLGLDQDNGFNLFIWQDSFYVMPYLQGLFLQVIDDVITFSFRGKIAVSSKWHFVFFRKKSAIMRINCVRKTLGILLRLNLGPCWKQFTVNTLPLS